MCIKSPLQKVEEKKFDVLEMKIILWIMGVTRRERITNEYISGTVKVNKASKRYKNHD
jgi:hypothetical protein